MQAIEKIQSPILKLLPIAANHSAFYSQLTQTPLWIKYIGPRNTQTPELALEAIKTIHNNKSGYCWVIQFQSNCVGIITLLKRQNLEAFDLGFAILPEFFGKGLAFEASNLVLEWAHNQLQLSEVIAISLPTNEASINLLYKLGFMFQKSSIIDSEVLNVYKKKLP